MATPSAPRTELTKRLERSKRQFFQWFYIEGRSIKQTKKEMDNLSRALRDVTGDDFIVHEGKWRNRQRHWNKREWRIQRRDRGPHLPIPAEIVHLPLWRQDGSDVGDWRKKAAAPVDEPPTSTALQDDSNDVYRHHELPHCDDHGGAFSLATPEENPGGWNSYNVSEQIHVTTRPPPRTSSISTWDTQASSGNHDSNLDLDTFSSFPPGNIQASAASFELPERTMPPQLELTGQPSFGGEIYLDHPTTTTSILDCHGLQNPQNDPGPCEYQLNWLWKDSWGSSKMSYQDPYGL